MSTVMYIKASPMGELSYSTAVADAFIEAYVKSHPDDEIKRLDIFERRLPAVDFATASAKYKIKHGKEHSESERRIWGEVVSLIDEFKSADKYVIATPMWNFSIPYRLKQYIDIIVQPGHTFTVTADGNYEGLVQGRPVFVAYARGGEYPAGSAGEAFDLQKRYLELVLGFMGLTEIRSVVIEPTLAGGADTAEQKRDAAVAKAAQMAESF